VQAAPLTHPAAAPPRVAPEGAAPGYVARPSPVDRMTVRLHRPQPILERAAERVDQTSDPDRAARALCDGVTLLVTDRYGTGADILERLDRQFLPLPASASFQDRQTQRRRHRDAAMRLHAPIADHNLNLIGARNIGFLKELYPELPAFTLPFIQAQELGGAWTRYVDGVPLAVLGRRLYPFYGTYVPTRTAHLELFATWLQQDQGPRRQAVDLGTGCGVLALMLARAGFQRVQATDHNPNAVESVARELRRVPPRPPIELATADLLTLSPAHPDLVVFNPPWIRGEADSLIDQALYYEDGLFERFFNQAAGRLAPGGRIVLLFSNINELLDQASPHPIRDELQRGRFRLSGQLHRKVKPTQAAFGPRRRTREQVEIWELTRA
jgi:SAM-dependent methyltransferase